MQGMLDIFTYLMCSVAGCFFSVMVFTILENASEGFRKIVDGYYKAVPDGAKKTIALLVGILALILIYMKVPVGPTRGGILAGAIIGIPLYFKSGVTMNKTFNMGTKYEKRSRADRKALKAQALAEEKAAKEAKRPKKLQKK